MKKEILKYVALILIAMGSGPAGAALWQWSKTAINNSTADPSINWSEGMSPSAVNDSARAMMARLAEGIADSNGSLQATGGPSAYTVTSNQGLPSTPNDGQLIAVTFPVGNGATPTLSVDGGIVGAIVSQPGTYAPPNTIIAGNPYTLRYNAASNWWMLRNFYGETADVVPIGGVIATTIAGNPTNTNYIVAAGQCISTTTYALYWNLLAQPGPGPCSAGQFQVIDLRGRVVAGTDIMGGSGSAGRLTTNGYGCGALTIAPGSVCNTTEYHYVSWNEMPQHNHGAPIYDPQHYHTAYVADPQHYHQTSTADPTHNHAAGLYDPGHGHNVTNGIYGSTSLIFQYYIGGTQGGQGGNITISSSGANGLGAAVNGGALGNGVTYKAATGVYMNSGNGANTTGSDSSGTYLMSSIGQNYVNYNPTGVRVQGAALDYTNNSGSSYPMTVVQPTMVLVYLIRVL